MVTTASVVAVTEPTDVCPTPDYGEEPIIVVPGGEKDTRRKAPLAQTRLKV